jgi:uracil-DNA glycosylase
MPFFVLSRARRLSAPVKHEWYENCRYFLKGTIDAVAAPTVIALGKRAYEAVARAYDLSPLPFQDAIERASPLKLDEHRRAFAVFHPAARPANRTVDQMRDDWLHIKSTL